MGFKCGIVGLPNVGKSTLFNALTETASAEAANYPFCTIEPNTGIVSVPDKRLKELSELAATDGPRRVGQSPRANPRAVDACVRGEIREQQDHVLPRCLGVCRAENR